MASPNQTCPRTGQGQQQIDAKGWPLRGPPSAGEPTSGIGRRASHLMASLFATHTFASGEEPRDRGRPTQAAIPHLPRIRMNACGAPPANSRIRREKLEGRSPVNRAMDGERQSDLPPDGAGARKRREGSRSRSPPRQRKRRRGRGGGPLTSVASLFASQPSRLPAKLPGARSVPQGSSSADSRNLR